MICGCFFFVETAILTYKRTALSYEKHASDLTGKSVLLRTVFDAGVCLLRLRANDSRRDHSGDRRQRHLDRRPGGLHRLSCRRSRAGAQRVLLHWGHRVQRRGLSKHQQLRFDSRLCPVQHHRHPSHKSGQTNIRTVTVNLCPSPLMSPMMPVNYLIGSPSNATVYVTPAVSNLPPVVNIVSPTNNAVFDAPANISLLARATGLGNPVTNVEFFAGTTDLGRGQPVVLDPPGVNGVTGPVYFLNWQNVPTNIYSLTAVITDRTGLSSVSAPVNITVQPGPPPTNRPPVVRITSPPNAMAR